MKTAAQLDGEIQAIFDYEKAGKPADVERWVDNWIRENRGKDWAQVRFVRDYVNVIRGRTGHATIRTGGPRPKL